MTVLQAGAGRVTARVVGRRRPARRELPPLRRLLLIGMPLFAAFGPFLPIIGPIYAFRAAAVIYFIFSGAAAVRKRASPFRRYLTVVAYAWLGIGLLLVPSALDPGAGIHELVSVGAGILFVVGVVRNWKPGQTVRDLRLGWLIAFAATGVIGTWEVVTGHHLADYFGGGPIEAGSGDLIASTFFNPNAYAVFLAAGAPFVLSYLGENRRPAIRVGVVVVTLWWAYLLIHTGGRLCIAATVIAIIVWLAVTHGRGAKPLLVIAALALVALFLGGSVGLMSGLPDKISAFSLASVDQSITQSGSSGNIRINLTLDGAHIIGRTLGIGAGPGNFVAQVRAHPDFYTRDEASPHNGLMELTAQYGVLMLLLVLVAIVRPVRWGVDHRWRGGNGLMGRDPGAAAEGRPTSDDRLGRLIVLCLAAEFLPLSLANSSLWVNPPIWITAAVFVAAALTIEPVTRAGRWDWLKRRTHHTRAS